MRGPGSMTKVMCILPAAAPRRSVILYPTEKLWQVHNTLFLLSLFISSFGYDPARPFLLCLLQQPVVLTLIPHHRKLEKEP